MNLLTRIAFIEEIGRIAETSQQQYTLLYAEINHTLQIASLTQGTAAAEALLSRIQALIVGKVASIAGASIGKLDRNRFGILLRLPVAESMEFAQQLANLLDQQCIIVADIAYYPKLIIGVTSPSPEYKTPERILAAVDEALFQAKRAGNSVVKLIEYDDVVLHEYYDLLKLLPELREGLTNHSFVLFAQPILPINGANAEKKAEVLLRYKDDQGDSQTQRRLLRAAELFHISREVDLYVVQQFCRYLAENPQPVIYSLNISGSTIRYPGFIEKVEQSFNYYGIDASKVCFEITETVADHDYQNASEFMRLLKDNLGCLLSLDDIGIGSSNLANLSKFNVDFFKIDGLFMQDLLQCPYSELVVSFITAAAKLFNKETVAEYVENAEQLEKLKVLGVDYAQGYYVGKPSLLFDPAQSV
ncbi:GGDEF domain-containing protein [Methylomicrobium sp. Wu6]|uniref:EAL domain-containing protein n=1 Tax=Methylomicrobium sp. Wu6 TaxID=3107928 RepID=UPI002DD62C05|nr:GGDEF domain-containing protein [Methylomicrobium sp. Wu6]MEC4749978.1 GGDEF domain-containing protein [Methylomicrobium sp. Wu6]